MRPRGTPYASPGGAAVNRGPSSGPRPPTMAPQKPGAGPRQPSAGPTARQPLQTRPQPAGAVQRVNGGQAAAAGGNRPSFTVSTQSKKDDIGISTLVGDFVKKGDNHGKPYFQKAQRIEGHEDIQVFLYYWDSRDGADFSGWWFGDALGGAQVWAKVSAHGPQPPRVGWKIPWDAEKAEPGVLLVDPYKGPASSPGAATPPAANRALSAGAAGGIKPAPAGAKPGGGALGARVKKATEQVDAAKATADVLITKSRKEATNDADADTLQSVLEELQGQAKELTAVQKSLTTDIDEARKGGVSTMSSVTELSKLSPKLRQVQASVTAELNKVKSMANKLAHAERTKPKTEEQLAEEKAKEESDAKELELALPAVQQIVTDVEAAVEGVSGRAAPLIDEPPEDAGAELQAIEDAANEAQSKISEGRKQVNLKLQEARKYAPTTRKTALEEFSQCQTKLTEAQKKLNPYKAFKKDFKARVEAKKSLSQMIEKLNDAELEVEKASMMSSAAESGQMGDDEVANCEKMVEPAQKLINDAIRQIDQKTNTAREAALKDELQALKDRASTSKKKLDAITSVLKGQKETITAREIMVAASDKVDKVEECLKACSEAEMPFLKGIEILPGEESTKAIKDSEAAITSSTNAIRSAQNYINNKLQEVRRFSKDVSKSITDDLKEISERLEASNKKLAAFKTETSERKTNAMMAEVVEAIQACEKKSADLKEAAKLFSSDDLEAISADSLKEAGEKAKEVEKEATAASQEARKIMESKRRDARAPDAQASLQKLQTRLSAAQSDISKQRKAIGSGDKLIKGKEVLLEQDTKVSEAEADVKKAEDLASPADAGLGNEKISEEAMSDLVKATENAQTVLKSCKTKIEAQLQGALPVIKAGLDKLNDRIKVTQEKLTKVMATTKDQREQATANLHVEKAKEQAAQMDAAMEKIDEAELPFLKGIESLPLQETNETIKASEAASSAASKVINDLKTFIASKSAEVKKFKEEVAKKAAEDFATVTERITTASKKLSEFKNDTAGRKKAANMQEATEQVSTVEAEVAKLAEAVKPFVKEEKKPEEKKEGEEAAPEEAAPAPEMDEATANELCAKIVEISKVAQAEMEKAKKLIQARNAEIKEGDALKEQLKTLSTRLADAQKDFSKHKRVAKEQEDKYTAKKVIAEAEEMISNLQDNFHKLTESGATLLEHGGTEFLIAASCLTLANGLREHMKDKEKTVETLFGEIAGGEKLMKDAFVSYLEKLPETLGKEELTFTADRRNAIFQVMDEVGGGVADLSSFKELFVQKYRCVKGITITDGLEVGKSKTICKLEIGEMVEAVGAPQKDEATGMTRCECKTTSGEKSGWVTLSGNQGSTFLEPWTPFAAFTEEYDRKLEDMQKSINEVSNFVKTKDGECARGGRGPLSDARTELGKLRPKVATTSSNLEQLRKKVAVAKRDYSAKERREKNAHIEAKEQKEADAILAEVTPKIEAMEANNKNLEEVSKPLTGLATAEVLAFETPASTSAEVDSLVAATTQSVADAKTAIKEAQAKVAKAVKGPLNEAKKELQNLESKAAKINSNSRAAKETVKKACKAIVDGAYAKVSTAMRSDLQAKEMSLEKCFEDLAKSDGVISEESFCSHLASLAALADEVKPEHAKLLFRHIQAGGIGKSKFMAFLQQYFCVVKSIAITNEFDVGKAKTLRKAELDEIVEVLEGPRTDEKIGLQRVRVKSLADGQEGWISIQGNQGTPFLKEVKKPCYSCTVEQPFEKESKPDGQEPIRMLKRDEVLELLEGPRTESFEPALRVKGKATKDGETGWFTATDRNGVVFAKADDRSYACTATVAMTDDVDIKNCKVIRKLVVGELFTLIDGPNEDADAGITRVKGKCSKDDKEGWITVKGNAGTVYAEVSSKHYSIVMGTPLHKKLGTSGAEVVRQLEKDEMMEVLEKPKEEKFAAEKRIKCRALEDGAVGWISQKADNVKSWTPFYRCKVATPIHDTVTIEGATVVRELAVGESVELVDHPRLEGKCLRMNARAVRDGVVGWVTIRDGDKIVLGQA